MKILLVILVCFAGNALAQESVHTRDLVRGIVTECVSEEPAPQVLSDTEQLDASVEGAVLPVGVTCRTLDSYVDATASGQITEYRSGHSLTGITYKAEIQGLGTKYRTADFAAVSPGSASGARYIASSEVFYMGDSFDALRYNITFIRRQQAGVADIPATIMVIQKQVEGAILLFTLDYRG